MRLILIGHRGQDQRGRAAGKLLLDGSGYLDRAWLTNLPRPVQPLAG